MARGGPTAPTPVAGNDPRGHRRGNGQFAAAFSHWFDLTVLAVEPSAAMRIRSRGHPRSRCTMETRPPSRCPVDQQRPPGSHSSSTTSRDLGVAAHQTPPRPPPRRTRPHPTGLPGQTGRGRLSAGSPKPLGWSRPTPPSRMCARPSRARDSTGRSEQVRETYPTSLADFFAEVDTFRDADTTMRTLSDDEFLRGKDRLRRAVRRAEDTAFPESRSNWLDLLVLR